MPSNKNIRKAEKNSIQNSPRKTRVLEHRKDGKVFMDKGEPTKFEGSDGDMQIREVNEGRFLFTKFKGSWLTTRLEDTFTGGINDLIYSNTKDGDMLLFDETQQQYISKKTSGDITLSKEGKFTIKKNSINSSHIKSKFWSQDIYDNSIYSNHIAENAISPESLVDNNPINSQFTIVADTAASLDVGGAKAEGILTFTGVPNGGTAPTGTIVKTDSNGYLPISTDVIIIDDTFDTYVFEFYESSSYSSSYIKNKQTVGVSINKDSSSLTMEALKDAINNNTNITASRTGLTINLTHKVFSAEGNITITQEGDSFTLTGMTGGVDGDNIEIPPPPGISENILIKFRDATSIDNTKNKFGKNFVRCGASASGTGDSLVSFIDEKFSNSFSSINSSGAVTITAKDPGPDGNGSFVDNSTSVTVTQNMQNGAFAQAKYFLIYTPLDYRDVVREEKADLTKDNKYIDANPYMKIMVWFNIDGTHQKPPVDSDDSIEIKYSDDDFSLITNTATAQDISDALVYNMSKYTLKRRGIIYRPFTATNSGGTTVSVGNTKGGYVPSIADGDSGLTLATTNNGGWYLTKTGDFKIRNKTSGNLQISSVGNINIKPTTTLSIENVAEVGSDTDKFLMLDGDTVKYVTGADLKTYIDAGDISFDGSTANGVCTYKDADEVTVESTLTYSAQLLTLSGGDTKITASNEGGDGYDLTLAAGTAGSGVNNHGGNILLEAGTSTGSSDGGYLSFSTSEVDGVSGSTPRARETVLYLSPLGNMILNDADGYPGEYRTYNRNTGTTYAILKSSGLYSNTSLSVDGGDGSVTIDDDGHTYATFTSSDSSLKLHEAGTDASGEYFKIACGVGGSTDMTTTSSILPTGHLTINPYGKLSLNGQGAGNLAGVFCETLVRIKEVGSSATNLAGYGQLWTKDRTPNELWFTNDDGDDIQITQGSILKQRHYMDFYYISATLATQNTFYAEKHHDEFGVNSSINTDLSSSGYSTTTLNNGWRMYRYARRVPYSGNVTKFMVHCESTGADADSDVEVALWWADSLADDTEHSTTVNYTCAHLGTIAFDFSSASRHMTKTLTSFNATAISEGDWLFITARRTNAVSDGRAYNIHSTILWEE